MTSEDGCQRGEFEIVDKALEVLRKRREELIHVFEARRTGGVQAAFEQAAREHKRIHADVFSLAQRHVEEQGLCRPPGEMTFLMLGSGARGEQSILSDQDHALVFELPDRDTETDATRAYVDRLTRVTAALLSEVGYALCSGHVMASNPRWQGTLLTWQNRLEQYYDHPDWENIRFLLIAADATAIVGHTSHASALREGVASRVARSSFIRWKIADQALVHGVALTPLGQIRLEGVSGKGYFHVKEGLYTPLVNSVRLWAHSVLINVPQTLSRIEALTSQRVWSEELADRVKEAFVTTLDARVGHHLRLYEERKTMDDRISLSELDDPSRRRLKDALRTAKSLQQMTAKQFARSG